MALSASEAAKLVGMSKGGIIKAMRNGTISAQKDERGEWRVEPVELFRVYPPANSGSVPLDEPSEHQDTGGDTIRLQVENEQLKQRLADKEREVASLWKQLENESDERRRLTFILTDKQNAAPQEEPHPSFWSRLFGRRA